MSKPHAIAAVSRSLDDYTASAHFFARKEAELQKKHPNRWVGVYRSRVCAIADTLDGLVTEIEKKNIPTTETLARKLEVHRKTLIL